MKFSTVFYSVTDGQMERIISILEDMLLVCVLEFVGFWNKRLFLIEFLYNNNYYESIGMVPYEVFYRTRCRRQVCWNDISEIIILGSKMIKESVDYVYVI